MKPPSSDGGGSRMRTRRSVNWLWPNMPLNRGSCAMMVSAFARVGWTSPSFVWLSRPIHDGFGADAIGMTLSGGGFMSSSMQSLHGIALTGSDARADGIAGLIVIEPRLPGSAVERIHRLGFRQQPGADHAPDLIGPPVQGFVACALRCVDDRDGGTVKTAPGLI